MGDIGIRYRLIQLWVIQGNIGIYGDFLKTSPAPRFSCLLRLLLNTLVDPTYAVNLEGTTKTIRAQA